MISLYHSHFIGVLLLLLAMPLAKSDVEEAFKTAMCGTQEIQPNVTQLMRFDNKRVARMIRAKAAVPNSWPWVAFLVTSDPATTEATCGGVIVDRYHVLTAAHCGYGAAASSMKVFVGFHYMKDRGTGHTVKRFVRHPDWSQGSNNHEHWTVDLAVLTLNEPLEFSRTVEPICLPDQGIVKVTDDFAQHFPSCMVASFGSEEQNVAYEEKVMKQAAHQIMRSTCSYVRPDDVNPLCTHGHGMTTACHGDSGSALMCKENGLWKVQGVLVLITAGCSTGEVGWARVYDHLDWIREQMNTN